MYLLPDMKTSGIYGKAQQNYLLVFISILVLRTFGLYYESD